jgi:hypothetical protein
MADPDRKRLRLEETREGNFFLEELASEAKPQEVTEPGRIKLFKAYLRAERTIADAKRLLRDAYVDRENCAQDIVKKLGRGHHRYEGVLYATEAKKKTVYLRRLKQKVIDG